VTLAAGARTGGVLASRRVARALLWLVVGPHELAHWIAFRPWGRVRIVGGEGSGLDAPLARLSGQFSTTIPTTAVRCGALAPTVLYAGLAVGVDAVVDPAGGAASIAAGVVLALWAAPSHGDLTVFLRAPAVKAAGSFDVEGPPATGAYALSALLTLLSTGTVVGLFAT